MRACVLTQQRLPSCLQRSGTCRGGSSAAARSGRSSRLYVASKLVLTPTGSGSTEHLGDEVFLPPSITLQEGLFEVGRAEPADIVIPIPTVSTRHCMLRISGGDGGSVIITDLGSTNGTFVDGKELGPMEASPLPVGSEVVFGDQFLAAFRLESVPDGAPALAEEQA